MVQQVIIHRKNKTPSRTWEERDKIIKSLKQQNKLNEEDGGDRTENREKTFTFNLGNDVWRGRGEMTSVRST